MLGNVFLKSLRDQRRSFVWWAIGLAAVTLLTVLFYPSIEGSPELNELLGDEDSIMRAFVGDLEDMTSPEGFLNSQLYFLLVPLLLIVFAVAGGSGAIAGEEEKGILDLLFSHPVRRSTVVLHKLAAMLVSVLALAAVAWIAVVVGALAVDMDIGADRVAAATLSAALLGSLFGALALALGAATGKRGMTLGISGAGAVFAYLVNALGPISDVIEPAKFVSPSTTTPGPIRSATALTPFTRPRWWPRRPSCPWQPWSRSSAATSPSDTAAPSFRRRACPVPDTGPEPIPSLLSTAGEGQDERASVPMTHRRRGRQTDLTPL